MSKGGFGGQMNNMMRQMQKLQKKMAEVQEELKALEVDASAGGGMVTAVVNGEGNLVRMVIDPDCIDPEDRETLQDMIVAAVGEAQKRAKEINAEKMGKFTAGMGLPPGLI